MTHQLNFLFDLQVLAKSICIREREAMKRREETMKKLYDSLKESIASSLVS